VDASAAVDDVFLRQPFQRRAGGNGQALGLAGDGTGAAVELAGGRGGEAARGLSGSSAASMPQFVAADHAAGGMKNGDMADGLSPSG
jgi:hypothetical protein